MYKNVGNEQIPFNAPGVFYLEIPQLSHWGRTQIQQWQNAFYDLQWQICELLHPIQELQMAPYYAYTNEFMHSVNYLSFPLPFNTFHPDEPGGEFLVKFVTNTFITVISFDSFYSLGKNMDANMENR